MAYFLDRYRGRIALSSSMGAEDQVLTDMILRIDPSVRIFTLDTGRMFPEVYELIDRTNKKYNIAIEVFFPDAAAVEKMVREKGINLFYEGIENRKQCCGIRKTQPLKRALGDLDIWVCGLRSDQSLTRINTRILEWDDTHGLLKLSPLAHWSNEEVWAYLKRHHVPYNPLHNKGFPSIGCQPCTRAIEPGDDIRAGRWWWEQPESRECGLHQRLNGKRD
jgi:phosphoadenosine phosphosulfate reductase